MKLSNPTISQVVRPTLRKPKEGQLRVQNQPSIGLLQLLALTASDICIFIEQHSRASSSVRRTWGQKPTRAVKGVQ